MKRSEVDYEKLSPMMKEYYQTKEEYEDVILFYRLGDFYELFFDDALVVSHELELTLTGKSAGLDERVPMCGVPYHAVNTYIEKLIDKGYKVAICEQMEDPKSCKGLVKRQVIQIVSKGTYDGNLNEKDFNYIGYISDNKVSYTLCYLDYLSGCSYALNTPYNKENVISYLVNLNIKEVVVSKEFDKEFTNILKNIYNIYVSYYDELKEDIDNELLVNVNDLSMQKCIKTLFSYIENNYKRTLYHFQKVSVVKDNDYLYLDKECVKNLELVQTIRDKDRKNSLFWFLDNTKTAMGSRLLKTFIINPSTSFEEIEKRHNAVETLIKEFMITSRIRQILYEIYDLERLCGKISYNNVNARDLLCLKSSLKVLPELNELLLQLGFEGINIYKGLYNLLDSCINEDAPISIKEGNIIKAGYDHALDELKDLRNNTKDFISKFELEEKNKTNIKSLKIGYNKVFGYFIEVSKKDIASVKEEYGYIRKQTISTGERYVTQSLKEKEDIILNAEDKINNMEYELFCSIRDAINNECASLQSLSSYIAYIDVMVSFASICEDYNFVRPQITNKHEIELIESRHPVVEKVLNNKYISNDIVMKEDENILIITGPNMSGKSTYMRQLGICVILNQIGCFIPAKKAVLPIFDKIFTRIGASDDLTAGESTFMVEMKESATAVRNATSSSLILFDELGRGTSTYDGMALAGSIIKYINKNIKCKTLFSTHYHELTNMEEEMPGIKNIHVSVLEENGEVKFLHKIKEGPVSQSYGINVARLALLPKEVITEAFKLLNSYEKPHDTIDEPMQLSFAFDDVDEIREELKKIDPLNITPMQAINILYDLKNKL